MNQLRILLVTEFLSISGAPTGALASDFLYFAKTRPNIVVTDLTSKFRYVPGGLGLSRLFNIFYLNCTLPLIVFKEFLYSKFHQSKFVIFVTSSPPMMQITAALVGKIFNVDVIYWLQDAHPELEARILEKKNLKLLAQTLRYLEKITARFFHAVIALDQSMAEEFKKRVNFTNMLKVIPPWSTYISPAKHLRRPPRSGPLNFIYAGNYGTVHDLSDMAKWIHTLEAYDQANFSFTFVGMNNTGQERLMELFEGTKCSLKALPRFAKKEDLVEIFSKFDFGLVSLSHEQLGISCPSKAFTYLSQGLPILYVGPEDTLGWELCQKGWGLTLGQLQSERSRRTDELRAGELFANPQLQATSDILRILTNGLLLSEPMKDTVSKFN